MLTRRDKTTIETLGLVPPDRLRALMFALLAEASDARAEAARQPDTDSQFAASLRGKAKAYDQARHMVKHVLDGDGLHPRKYSSARLKTIRARAARAERRAQAEQEDAV